MYGAILYASSKMHRVYAPSTHALPLIKPIHNPFGPEIQPVEITIASCGSRLRMLKQISPRFGRIWNSKPFSDESNITPIDCTKRSFVSVSTTIQHGPIQLLIPGQMQSSAEDAYQRPLESLEPPADWQTIIMELLSRHSARNPAAVLVCGPKGAGKSTFCRMLGNALLTKPTKEAQPNLLLQDLIALLDLDPGQPEFSPPGDVSLSQLHSCNFGPPFTHPTVPPGNGSRLIRSHHVGHLSPKDDPSYYLTCAYDLINTYHGLLRSHPACPIVINCPGWVQGSGLELLAGLIKVLHPTKVVYLSLLGPEEVVDTLSKAASNAKTQLHQISSQPSQAVSRTASELRMMQTLSYFHLDEPEIGNLCWNSCPLIQRAPQVIHYTGPKQAILAVMILGEEQKPEFFESIFEGCVVGIVVIEDDSVIPVATAPSTHKESEQITYEELDSEGVEDSHMDSEVNDLRPNEFPEGLDNRVPSKGRDRNGGHSDPGYGAPLHLQHPSIQRTPTGIPYIPPTDHITTPFSPSHSHSLGQALIRSIDPNSKTIHLLTPIPPSTLQSLHREKRKIVLVRGKLDTPTWAYKEQLELEKTRRRRREQDLGVQEEWDEEAMREWARETPWAGVVEGGRKGSAKARRVRRDIKYRGQGGGGVSE